MSVNKMTKYSLWNKLYPYARVFFLIFCFGMQSMIAEAKRTKDDSKNDNEYSLEEIIWQLRDYSGLDFMYSDEDIVGIRSVLNQKKNQSVEDVLKLCLDKTDLEFFREKDVIIIRKKSVEDVGITSQVEREVSGLIVDENGEPLPGVTVVVKGTSRGAATGLDGKYKVNVTSEKDVLIVSFIGYKTQEIQVGKRNRIDMKMEATDAELDEVVVVGAGVQKKVSVTGAISSIKGSELRVPSTSLTSALAGRLAGVISTTSSGEPGTASQFFIRGIGTFGGRATPLIILDGVEISSADLNYLPAESIESFSILKDASATAIYGARGANGVMIVTTKVGKENERTKINVTLENSVNMPTSFPDFVDGATWMEMYNEAQTTRDHSLTPRYSQDLIENTRSGLNPYIYPDVDWEELMFKDFAMSQRANVNIQGGGSKATYYMSLQANHDSGILNTKDLYSWDNNINIMSYTFQNNINYNVTKSTKVGLRMNAQLRNRKSPNKGSSELFGMMLSANPVAAPAFFPDEEGVDHVRFGSAYLTDNVLRTNPYAQMLTTYKEAFENTINVSATVDQKLDFITKGLKIGGIINFKNWSQSSFTRSITPYYYRVKDGSYDPNNPTDFELENIGPQGKDYIDESDISKTGDRTYMLQFTLDWARTLGKNYLSAMLLYQQREYQTKVLPNRNQTFSGRFTYDYDHRYLFEVNFGYNGTERLAKEDRFELFPAVSLGWVISREKFFSKWEHVVSNLKVRGSYGLVGSDETGPAGANHFLYIDDVTLNNIGFTTGEDLNFTLKGPIVNNYGVQNAGWERVKKLNVGVDLQLFGKLNLTADYFFDHRYNILLHREAWPESLGFYGAKPWSSIGEVENTGFDMSMNYSQSITNNLTLELRGTATYNQNKYINLDEPVYPYTWQTMTGKPLSHTQGYIAEGLFQSQEEIDNSPMQQLGSSPMVGDIKYRDVNGDGIISEVDRVMLSEYGSQPRLQYGFGATLIYKKLDVGVFFNGSGKRKIMVSGIHPFGSGDANVLQFIADDYWTESNPNPDAKYPRLGLMGSNTANNHQSSSYWMRDASFLRFKNFEVGYRFSRGRLYVSGNNLATFSEFKDWDPETAWNAYPMQRTFNLGLQLNF